MLRVCALGELRVEHDGSPVALPRRRPARALLGWLALHPGLHARSSVAAALWPNVLDESARSSLRTALSALRPSIGADALVATRERVGLAPDVRVDVHEFGVLLEEPGRELDALALCSGELLEGFDEDWVLVARDAHRERVAELLSGLATAAAARGDHGSAVGFARRRAALDPFDEPAQRALMQLLYQAGDRARALAAYERFADRLRRELGVAVSPSTRAVAAELRNGPAVAAPLVLPARITAARQRGSLVGRTRELAELSGAWARSMRQGRHLALVTGEPGIGKTRLVSEFAGELGAQGVGVLYGRVEEEALVPYQPVVEALGEPLRRGWELPPEAAELSALLPDGSIRENLALGVSGAPSGSGLRMFEAVATAIEALAARRPLLLVLDDLHWAEPPTIRLVRYLAARPTGAPQMIVGTYRDTEDHPWAQALPCLYRELPVQRIALAGLGPDAVAELVGGERSVEDVRALCEHTGGNPFFIQQLLPGDRAGLRETVGRRVGALGAEARAVLDAGAVSGAEFELAVVAEVVGLPLESTLDVLDAAVKARLIAEVPEQPGRYAFVHAIVRDTLAGSLSAARRTRLHELFCAALEGRVEREPDRYLAALAHHALEAAAGAGDPVRAVDLAQQAAARAGAVLAYEDAATLLRRAATVLERRGGSAELQAELQCALAEALARAGSIDEARRSSARAGELARTTNRPDLLARSALALGGAGVTILGADRETVASLDRALDAIGSDHPVLRVRLLARLAIELAYDADPARRDALSQEALELARTSDEPAALASALNARHVIAWGPDGCEERLGRATEMLELAERAGDRELALQARHWRVVDLFELGDGPALRDEITAYADLSAQVRLPAFAWYVPLWRATLAMLEGRIDDGIALSRRAHDLGRQAGDANAEVFYAEQYLLRMVVQGRIRDVDPAVDGVEGGVDVAERAQRGPAWRAYRFTFAWWHGERGELDDARRDFESAVADGLQTLPRDVNWLAALASAVEACVLLGDTERASQLRALLEPHAARMVVTARGASHAGSVAYFAARAAALSGDAKAADDLFAQAARRDREAGATAFVVRDLSRHGEFLRAVGESGRGRGLLRAAAERARAVGLTIPSSDGR
jgi:DNA-binding SARP family transcriptional activator